MAMATGSTLPRSFRPRQDKLEFRWTIFCEFTLRESRICIPRFVGMEQDRLSTELDATCTSTIPPLRRRDSSHEKMTANPREIALFPHNVKMTFPPVAAYVYSPVSPAPPSLGKDEP